MSPTNKGPKGLLIIAHPSGAGAPGDADDEPSLGSPEEPDADDEASGDASQRCDNCRFWEPTASYCQRYPPHGNEWSQPDPSQWCGEWRPGKQHTVGGGADQQQPGMQGQMQQQQPPRQGTY